MNKELQVGDTVKVVSTRDKKDLSLVGQTGVVVQLYNGVLDIQKNSEYYTLSKSTVVRRVDAENDKLDEVQMNPLHDAGMYFIEYSMSTSTKVIARVYEQDSSGGYNLIDEVDVETLIWKYMNYKGIDL